MKVTKFPQKVFAKIQSFLEREKKHTQKRLETVKAEDPFSDPERVIDNAASDTEAKEGAGHDRVEAIKRELTAKLSRIEKALQRLRKGSYGKCENCGKKIDDKRLKIVPTATLCIDCEREREDYRQ